MCLTNIEEEYAILDVAVLHALHNSVDTTEQAQIHDYTLTRALPNTDGFIDHTRVGSSLEDRH